MSTISCCISGSDSVSRSSSKSTGTFKRTGGRVFCFKVFESKNALTFDFGSCTSVPLSDSRDAVPLSSRGCKRRVKQRYITVDLISVHSVCQESSYHRRFSTI